MELLDGWFLNVMKKSVGDIKIQFRRKIKNFVYKKSASLRKINNASGIRWKYQKAFPSMFLITPSIEELVFIWKKLNEGIQ